MPSYLDLDFSLWRGPKSVAHAPYLIAKADRILADSRTGNTVASMSERILSCRDSDIGRLEIEFTRISSEAHLETIVAITNELLEAGKAIKNDNRQWFGKQAMRRRIEAAVDSMQKLCFNRGLEVMRRITA